MKLLLSSVTDAYKDAWVAVTYTSLVTNLSANTISSGGTTFFTVKALSSGSFLDLAAYYDLRVRREIKISSRVYAVWSLIKVLVNIQRLLLSDFFALMDLVIDLSVVSWRPSTLGRSVLALYLGFYDLCFLDIELRSLLRIEAHCVVKSYFAADSRASQSMLTSHSVTLSV